MPKQLNVSLAFTADTSKAKAQLQDLQRQLTQLTNTSLGKTKDGGMVKEIQNATAAAAQLKVQLESATNVSTGKLDLGKFNDSLKQSGMTLSDYKTQLDKLGPEGSKAFLSLAQSISNAEMPLRRTNALFKEFGVTLMNAARWQFSSSVLHGLMGAIQGAYGYAQDLNKSLTDIAIVTGRSTDQMAAFADQANKSAQALSVSTTAYTDAALIYYQQGLDDEAVKARTDITMQMSNVTGESAEHVSSYMTAIWNNFAEGSENLEHYADVITALGAATASSSEEIANGMQQFASVADTVGLSYEYAATALATVVAQTRQSESTVGNSFRTIFSRLQGLKLGDTLEDGTDLNKYSKALATVGVNIKDQNGDLKDMDTILDEIGAKWQTLEKDQQVALAQTVGGVRQYTNLIALFENWDTFQKNLNTANSSDGALERQADIYAQSWEAAQKRVKAAWQAIYQDLVDEDFFIGLLNGFEKVLKQVDAFIDALGGVKGVLLTIGTIATSVLQNQIAQGIRDFGYSLKMKTAEGKDELEARKNEAWSLAGESSFDTATASGAAQSAQIEQTAEVQRALLENAERMTEQEQKVYQLRIDGLRVSQDELVASGKKLDDLRAQTDQLQQQMILKSPKIDQEAYQKNIADFTQNTTAYATTQAGFDGLKNSLAETEININNVMQSFDNLFKGASTLKNKELQSQIEDLYNRLDEIVTVEEEVNEKGEIKLKIIIPEDKKAELEDIQKTIQLLQGESSFQQGKREQRFSRQTGVELEKVQGYSENVVEETREDINQEENLKRVGAAHRQVVEDINNHKKAQDDLADTLSKGASTITSIFSAINMLSSAWKTFQNPDLTGWEKFSRIMMSVSMAIPMVTKSIKGIGETIKSFNEAIIALATKIIAKTTVTTVDTVSTKVNTAATNENTGATAANTGAKAAQGAAATGAAAGEMSLAAAMGVVTKEALKFMATPLGLTLMAIAAAIGVVVVAMKAAYDASPEGKLEAINKRLEEAKEKSREASEAYDELKSTLDEYKQVREDITNIEDSGERREAINDENKKILEMLHNVENWQELIGELQYDSNGLISLTDEQIKALENDKAREESLARQLELQEQINANTGNQEVEDSKYTGKKIKVNSAGTSWLSPDDPNYVAPEVNKDITGEVAGVLAKSGLGAVDITTEKGTDKIISALEKAGYDEAIIDQILPLLEEIAADEDSLKQFNEMQASHRQTDAENDAIQKQINQEAITSAEAEINKYGNNGEDSISSLSKYDEVQAEIAAEWENLSAELKEKVQKGGLSLAEALEKSGYDIEEANARAKDNGETERQEWREANINTLSDKLSQRHSFDERDRAKLEQQFSDEDLKIAMTLDLDKYKSIEEIKAAVEEVKQQTEEDRHFELEMTKAENAGLDMEDWQAYVDYLQATNEKMAENKILAAQVATANMRLNQGVESLIDDFGNYSEVLKEAGKEGNKWSEDNEDYAKGLRLIQKSLADIGNVDLETIQSFGKDFVTDNLDLIEKAAQGDIEAIDGLIKKIAEAQVQSLEAPIGIDTEQFESDKERLITAIDEVNFNDIEIGTSIDDQPFYDALVDMVNTGEIAASDINDVLAGINYTPIVEPTEVTATNYSHEEGAATGTITYIDPVSGETVTAEIEHNDAYNDINGSTTVEIPTIIGTNGGKAATAANLGAYLKNSVASGGTGKNLTQGNRNAGAKNKPKSSCFIAGTPIFLNNNYKNIEDIQVGDIVLSYNEQKKENVFSEVLQTMIHFVHEKIYSLFIKDEELKVTGNHKFLITRDNKQEWIQVSDLKIGDLVLLSDGTLQEINEIANEIKYETVYNFEVSNTHNYYVGKNKILAHNKGGGKGSGKDSAPKKQKREKLVDEKDRYHDIKEEIKDLNTEMDRLEKIKDRVFGKAKLKYMDQEIKKQEKQISLTKEYIKEAKNYLAEDKKRLDEIKMGAKYVKDDNTGEWLLTNYEEVLQNIVDAQNKAVDAFNDAKGRYENGEISEDELKAQEEAFNLDKEKFEERKKILKQYEDTYNTVQEQMEKLIDDQWKLYDLKLEKVKVEVEVDLKLNDESRKILEWSLKYMGDDLDSVADKVANVTDQTELWANSLESARSGIEKVAKNHGITLDLSEGGFDVDKEYKQLMKSPLTQAEVEYVQEMMQTIRDANDEIKQGLDDVLEIWDKAWENAWDNLSYKVGNFDKFEKSLQSLKDVVSLTGKNILNISNKDLDRLNQNLISNAQNRIRAARIEYQEALIALDANKALLDEAVAAGNTQAIELFTKRVQEADSKMQEMMENYAEAVQDALQKVEDTWAEALDHMEEDYKNAFGNLGLDWYEDQFERQKELSELYLPDYKKYHELNKAMSDLQKNIAQTNNQLIKGKGRELLEDITEKLQDGVNISEYEAGIIEKRVALLKAEDELLAARNAKTAVRMTRDNEGGFSYTYTADQDAVNQAQQNLDNAYYETRDFERTGVRDLEGSMLKKINEYSQRVREIEETFKDNEAGRAQALIALESEYDQYIAYYLNQFDVAYKWEGKLRNDDLMDMQRVLGIKLDNFNQFVDSWQGTILNKIMPGYENLNQFVNNWKTASENAVKAVNAAHESFVKNTEITFNAAGTSTKAFKEGYNLAMAAIQKDSENTTKDIANLGKQMVTSYADGFKEVSKFTTQYLQEWAKNRASDEESMKSIDKLIGKLGDLTTTAKKERADTETELSLLDQSVSTAVENINGTLDGLSNSMNGVANALGNLKNNWDNFFNGLKNTPKPESDWSWERRNSNGTWSDDGDKITSGATGMYTGDWHSSEGKLAVLHEKELVLNKEDTKNMLDAVNVIRSMQTPINGLTRNMFNYNSLNNVGSADTLEQQVHIDATFPNVSDHNEIELALDNLINSASQYINRK